MDSSGKPRAQGAMMDLSRVVRPKRRPPDAEELAQIEREKQAGKPKSKALGKRHSDYLKEKARQIYMTYASNPTADDIAAMPGFEDVGASTIKKWSAEGQWYKRRQELIQRYANSFDQDLAKHFLELRKEQFLAMERMMKLAMDRMFYTMLEVKSLEGLMKVVLQIFQEQRAVLREMSGEVKPEDKKTIDIDITEDEANALASFWLKRRLLQDQGEGPKDDKADESGDEAEEEAE